MTDVKINKKIESETHILYNVGMYWFKNQADVWDACLQSIEELIGQMRWLVVSLRSQE